MQLLISQKLKKKIIIKKNKRILIENIKKKNMLKEINIQEKIMTTIKEIKIIISKILVNKMIPMNFCNKIKIIKLSRNTLQILLINLQNFNINQIIKVSFKISFMNNLIIKIS